MNRKRVFSRAGFTLIELMVVILILGLLAGVIGIAVSNVIGDNSLEMDAQSLSKFSQQAQVAMSNDSNRRALKLMKDEKSAAYDVFRTLYERQVLSHATMQRLAGVTGIEGSAEEYAQHDAYGDGAICIFTGPPSVREFSRLIGSAKAEEEGIAMTYNRHNIQEYDDKGIVVLDAGDKLARVRKWEQFELHYGVPVANKAHPYGTKPFQNVVPE